MKKTLRKSKGNNSRNLDVSSAKASLSKIKDPFKLIPPGQWLWGSSFPLPSTCKGLCHGSCAENESTAPVCLSEVQICGLLPYSAVIQLSKPQCVFRNHKISPNNRLFASSQIPRLRKAFFFPPVLLFPTLWVKYVFRGKLKLSKGVRLNSSGNHSVHNRFLKQNTWWLMSMFLLWQNPSPPIFTPYFFSRGESTQLWKTMNRVFHLVAEQATIDG